MKPKTKAALLFGVIFGTVSSASAVSAVPVRLALIVGQDVGAPEDERLRYAEADARRIFDVLTTLGDVRRDRAYLLLDPDADRVRSAFGEIKGRAAELEAFGHEPILIIYVSSHADRENLRLSASRLPHAELRRLMEDVPARVRVLVVDACASGVLIRRKGGRAVVPFALDLERPASIQGQVILTSAGPAEPAQEWEALGGSLFTHHWVSALRGAADRDDDGRVTLFEAYSYAHDRTVTASVQTSAGPQHPSQEIDLRGAGDLMLTRPAGAKQGLVLGRALAGRYIITTVLGGELVASIDKAPQRTAKLALAPGAYFVRKPEGAFVRVGEVVVKPGSTVDLDEAKMERVPYAEVARRGPQAVHPRTMELSLGLATGGLAGQRPTPSLGLLLRRDWGPWQTAAGVSLAAARIVGRQDLTIEQRELLFVLEARWRRPFFWLVPYLGLSLGGGWIHQAFVREQEDLIRQLGYPAVSGRNGVAAIGWLALGIEVPLSARLVGNMSVAGGALAPRLDSGWTARPRAEARGGIGWRW